MSQTLKQVTALSAQIMQTSGLKANGTAAFAIGKDQFLPIKSANTLKSVWGLNNDQKRQTRHSDAVVSYRIMGLYG